MSDAEQTRAFISDISAVVDRYRAEFDITYAQVIGGLEMVKLELFKESMNEGDV